MKAKPKARKAGLALRIFLAVSAVAAIGAVGAVALATSDLIPDLPWQSVSASSTESSGQSSTESASSETETTSSASASQSESGTASSSVEPMDLLFPTATAVQGSSLSTDALLLSFLNSSAPAGGSFVSVVPGQYGDATTAVGFSKCYKDNGGLKLGTSTSLGFFCVQASKEFNRVVITGHSFSEASTVTSSAPTATYSCDVAGVSVNGANGLMFGTNSSNTALQAPTEAKEFDLASPTQTLYVSGVLKRITILSIELIRTA